jgi:adenylate cyclase
VARILIAEDEEPVRSLVVRALTEAGHDAVAAADGAEALDRLQSAGGGFDLVLADIKMPVMDGIALALAVARDFPALPILLMTGYADQRERVSGLETLICDVIAKPFSIAELKFAVASALAKGPPARDDGAARKAIRYNLAAELFEVAVTACDTRGVVDWLADGARSAPLSEEVLAELCQRLVGCGIPLWRVAVFVRTLHPEVMGRRFMWQPGLDVRVSEGAFDLLDRAEFRNSPFASVVDSAQAIRRKLADQSCANDFPILDDLRAEGITDYLASPLIFTDGAVHVATWSTREPGGFADAQVAGIEAIVHPLARVAEIRALRRTAANLLNSYVGHQAGERIMAGQIRRGHTDDIHAVIWLSDMRGFTAAADRLPPQDLLDLLNRYFECQVPAIAAHDGEVLKFMGDGLLAIFPIAADGADAAAVCRRALSAARDARSQIDALQTTMSDKDVGGVRFGLALHIGHVLYGNIGSGQRLDFTCIGPAVNLTARLEKLASQLGRSIVTSAEFARHVHVGLDSLGEFPVAGFSAPQAVFGLRDEAAAPDTEPRPAVRR